MPIIEILEKFDYQDLLTNNQAKMGKSLNPLPVVKNSKTKIPSVLSSIPGTNVRPFAAQKSNAS